MKLVDLDARFVQFEDLANEHSRFRTLDSRAGANGVMFYCPRCTAGKHAHYILCWDPSVPAVHAPGPGRWTLGGASLEDLTLSPSVVVNTCGAHFFVRDGAIVDC